MRAYHQIPVEPADWSLQCLTDLATFYRPSSSWPAFTYAYIDNVLVASRSAEEYKQRLHSVFRCLDEYGVIINPLKYIFGVKELTFLAHHVGSKGIWPLKDNVQAVQVFP